MAAANEWEDAAAYLHLREALKEGAQDCGRPQTLAGIFTALRARYGLSPREARTRLNGLRRDSSTTLQEHASEVQRLVEIAYADLPRHNRESMVIDTFCNTIGNAYLQRHLLAVPTDTLEDAVRAGNEFLQIKIYPAKSTVRVIEGEPEAEEDTRVNPVKATSQDVLAEGVLGPLTTLLQQLTEQLGKLQPPASVPGLPGRFPTRETICWKCNEPGHVQRRCPNRAAGQSKHPEMRRQGNGSRLQ